MGFSGIPPHYQVKYEREGASQAGHQDTVSVHVSGGDNTRVNVGSVDQSVNVSSTQQTGATFDKVRELLKGGVADPTELQRLLEKVEEMQQAHAHGSFKKAYAEFMALAANHMVVLAPVLPALAELL